jgi:ABC-type multidrug transport system fused ATPase/permease subunit
MIPKFALETIAFGGLLLIVLYLLYTRRGLSLVLPLIGLYTFAGYRLLPALQAIFWGAAQVRFNGAALDVLRDVSSAPYNSVREVDLNGGTALPFNSVLELKGVTFYYPGTDAPVIEDLNLSIRSGSSVAFVGRTGSGKTTIADLILGLLSPSAGCIRADDVEITDENRSQWQRNLGYVPQEIYLTDDTVARNIALGIPDERIDIVAVQRAAQVAKIHDFIVNELPEGYQAKVGERGIRLSGGERQRVGIARALYQNPGVLVLDEATSALDGATEEAVFHTIESVGRARTLIIVAHRLTTVRHCDVLYVVEAGRIVARGKYDELMMSCPEFRRLARMPPS